jgi:hypothetical protein
MKHFILSLLLLPGVVAKAQTELPTAKVGDTTFYFIQNDYYLDVMEFEITQGMSSMGIQMIGSKTYLFRHDWDNDLVYALPYDDVYPGVAISYPYENHTYNNRYESTKQCKDLRKKYRWDIQRN